MDGEIVVVRDRADSRTRKLIDSLWVDRDIFIDRIGKSAWRNRLEERTALDLVWRLLNIKLSLKIVVEFESLRRKTLDPCKNLASKATH